MIHLHDSEEAREGLGYVQQPSHQQRLADRGGIKEMHQASLCTGDQK